MGFVGRSRELRELAEQLDVVREGARADRGVALLVRGRRRVGKSRLVTEFVERAGVPSVYFQAARGAPSARELAALADSIAASTLPDAAVAQGAAPGTLTAALTLLAAALPDDTASVVVLDEVPWLLEGIAGGAGELQRVWDIRLSRKPVMLVLLGSDLTAMEHLTGADQPFYGRGTEMVLEPLSPHDVARMVAPPGRSLDDETVAFDGVDAYLVTGGLPLVAQEWAAGTSMAEFLGRSFASSTSALVVSGTRMLDSEFPEASLARQVLTAIGGRGERTFSGIQSAARGEPLNAASLTSTLRVLQAKRVVMADEPLSTRPGARDRRYRIADPALRFWLAFVEPALPDVDRGRPDLAVARVAAGYPAWRGRAVESVVRTALGRLLPDERWPKVRQVGGWWPRTNTPEVDLVGSDDRPADHVSFVGTVKWRRDAPVTPAELRRLARDAVAVPGVTASSALVAVCPAGVSAGVDLAEHWTARDLLTAWP